MVGGSWERVVEGVREGQVVKLVTVARDNAWAFNVH